MRHLAHGGLLAALALAGCRHAGITRLADAPAKPAGCTLQLFTKESEVGRPFQAVCLVDTETRYTMQRPIDPGAVAETARRQACDCGGDAMIVQTPETEGGNLTVKVIRFTGP